MKRALSLILALVLCLSLCACGTGNETLETPSSKPETTVPETTVPETTAPKTTFQLGETIVTNNWEITLFQVTFGTNLCKNPESKDYMIVDGDYEATITSGGKTYKLAYVAEAGRAFVAIGYKMKYTGKEKIELFNHWPDMKVDYNDGYLFADSPYADGSLHVWTGACFEDVDYPDLEPLSPEAEYRDCFDVPKEVMENTSGSVKIVIDLGQDGTFTYVVR